MDTTSKNMTDNELSEARAKAMASLVKGVNELPKDQQVIMAAKSPGTGESRRSIAVVAELGDCIELLGDLMAQIARMTSVASGMPLEKALHAVSTGVNVRLAVILHDELCTDPECAAHRGKPN